MQMLDSRFPLQWILRCWAASLYRFRIC